MEVAKLHYAGPDKLTRQERAKATQCLSSRLKERKGAKVYNEGGVSGEPTVTKLGWGAKKRGGVHRTNQTIKKISYTADRGRGHKRGALIQGDETG